MTHDRARKTVADSQSVEERPIAENDFTERPLIFNPRWDIRRLLAVMLAVVFVADVVPAENQLAAQSAPLAFDAVSIKENKTANLDGIFRTTSGRFIVTNLSVASLIKYAYRLRNYQLIDVPNWASSTPYDVMATYPEGTVASTDEQVRRMVQTLLTDRFGLHVHRETRQLPAYELRLARGDGRLGPQLVSSPLDCDNNPPPSTGRGGFPICQGFQNRALISGKGRRLDALATALEAMVQQKVLNRTGLTGTYDWNVRWEGARGPTEEATVEEIAAMITALEGQLGLKLQSIRAPEEVVVVDAIRLPTAN
jgi:uncharacterized protein (TIGR03435 family)